MRLAVVACSASLLLTCACGGEEDEPTIEPGGCVSVDDDTVEPVSCDSDAADHVLVYSIDPDPQYSCEEGLKRLTFNQVLNGNSTGIDFSWCVGTPGQLTEGQQARLDEEKAEETGNR